MNVIFIYICVLFEIEFFVDYLGVGCFLEVVIDGYLLVVEVYFYKF